MASLELTIKPARGKAPGMMLTLKERRGRNKRKIRARVYLENAQAWRAFDRIVWTIQAGLEGEK